MCAPANANFGGKVTIVVDDGVVTDREMFRVSNPNIRRDDGFHGWVPPPNFLQLHWRNLVQEEANSLSYERLKSVLAGVSILTPRTAAIVSPVRLFASM